MVSKVADRNPSLMEGAMPFLCIVVYNGTINEWWLAILTMCKYLQMETARTLRASLVSEADIQGRRDKNLSKDSRPAGKTEATDICRHRGATLRLIKEEYK